MEQRVSLITLGVADLAAARAFYEQLGWRGREVEETVFFQAGGLGLVLWGREKLAADSGVEDSGGAGRGGAAGGGASHGGAGFGGIALAHNVRTREEVDAIAGAAEAAGATITKAPGETFYGGYAACFTDLDGHVWEVAHNPGFTLEEDGALRLPF